MNHVIMKTIAALTSAAVTAGALSHSLHIMALDSRVRAAEAALALGDVNGDGHINATDAQLALAAAAEIIVGNEPDLDDKQIVAADIDYNKDVTPIDAQYILTYFLHETVLEDPITWYELTGIKPPAGQPALLGEEFVSQDQFEEMVKNLDYSVATKNEPVETSMTGEMTKVFQGMTPTEAYEYLYNRVGTEFYFGSRKGAIGTFEETGGNDIDQASLMIAVLRYLGYEADYYTALVELTADQMMEITATDNAEIAYKIFREQASAQVKTVDALRDDSGKLTGMNIEHTWVTAKLPSKYVNGDKSEELVEVQLDTSFKKGVRKKTSDVMNKIFGEGNTDVFRQAISSGNADALQSVFDSAVHNYNGMLLSDALNLPEIQTFRTVPVAENKVVSEQQITGSDYLKGRTDQIQINLGGINAALINAPEAYGKQLVIEYDFDDDYDLFEEILMDVPETIFDITNYYTKMGIKVQPKVILDGREIGAGTSVEIGTEQKMTISVYTGGAVQELKTTNMLSGSMYAITLDMQSVSDDEVFRAMQKYSFDVANKGFRQTYNAQYAGAYLSMIGKRYMAEADMMKNNYADHYDIHTERFMSVCVSAFNLEITRNRVGEIKVEERGTIGLDVKSDSYTAVSLKENQKDIDDFYLNVGIEGSYLEGTVIQKATGSEGISTMYLFDQAKAQDIEILKISKENEDYQSQLDLLAQNGIPAQAREDIAAAVEAGSEVLIPEKTMTAGQWSGSPYIVINDAGFSYMLSNLTNGGESQDPQEVGYLEYLFGGHDDFYDDFYWIALILAFIAFIVSLVALIALLITPTTLMALLGAAFAFVTATLDLYESVIDLLDFYNGEEDATERLKKWGGVSWDLIVMFFIKKIVL